MIQMDFLQNRNRITDIKNKLMVPKAGRNRINSEFGIKIYTLPSIKEKTKKSKLVPFFLGGGGGGNLVKCQHSG